MNSKWVRDAIVWWLIPLFFSACVQKEKIIEIHEINTVTEVVGSDSGGDEADSGDGSEEGGTGEASPGESGLPGDDNTAASLGKVSFSIAGGTGSAEIGDDAVEVLQGSEVNLEWDAESAASVTISKDNTVIAENLPAKGNYKITVDGDAIYTVLAKQDTAATTASMAVKMADTICLGQPNCKTNIGRLKGFGLIYYQPFACTKPDGTVCLMVADAGNNRVLRYCGENIKKGKPDLVLGQPDLLSSEANRGGAASQATLNTPRGVWCDGSRILVADTANHRVLAWNGFENLRNGDAASAVLGQPNFQWNLPNRGAGPTDRSLKSPTGVWMDAETQKIFVTDSENQRVLIKNSWPTASGDQVFNVVVGQADFVSNKINRNGPVAANTLWAAHGVSTRGGKLIISDSWNNRVLIFNRIPTTNGVSADFVIGQPGFGKNNPNQGSQWLHPMETLDFGVPNATTLVYPVAAYADQEGFLWVSDMKGDRILRFPLNMGETLQTEESENCAEDSEGISPCPKADRVIGFEDFDKREDDFFPTGTTYISNERLTRGAAASPPVGCRLFVKVLLSVREFDLCGAEWNNPPAVGIIGQPNYQGIGMNHAITSEKVMNNVYGVWADDKGVWVADKENHRVLGFKGYPIFSGAKADFVLGQADFTGDLVHRGADRPSRLSLNGPYSVTADSSRIYVSDTGNQRLMIWQRGEDGGPVGDPFVAGQAGFDTLDDPPSVNPGCNRFRPTFAMSDATRLWVTDVSKWNADKSLLRYRLLGFDLATLEQPSPEGILSPPVGTLIGERSCDTTGSGYLGIFYHVFSDGTHLLITDTARNRILYFETIPEDWNAEPDFVIGETNPASGPTDSSLNGPSAAILYGGLIFVADRLNHRVLVFEKPERDTPKAVHVFGQENFTTNFVNGGKPLSSEGFNIPRQIWIHGRTLYIADVFNQRIVVKNIGGLLDQYAPH